MSLRELYQEMILDHGKHPRSFGSLATANHHQAGHNPLCGDKLVVYVLEHDGIVEDLRFEGVGCAISVASASLMTEVARGKKVTEIKNIFDSFHVLVTEGKVSGENIGKLEIFGGVSAFPARVKCATLAWHTLMAALDNKPDPVSTE
jgi:nitrogen fixation NifU-like protein